jgi:glycosyltransferase involved in cell wall biosynthesis
MIRVTHIITGLAPQGAEAMLYKLVFRMDRSAFTNEVISLTNWHENYPDWAPIRKRLEAWEVQVRALSMRRGILSPSELLRLVQWLRRSKTDVVQTWMYHANLIGGIAARFAGAPPVVWGIHHSNLDPAQNKRHTIWTAQACARLSHTLPRRIICCSESSRQVHADCGYSESKMTVIPNGFDLSQFRRNREARSSVKHELGIPEEARLVGIAARFHPLKGYRYFIEAAARLCACMPDVHFLLCGRDVDPNNRELAGWIDEAGNRLSGRCHLLGIRQDMPRFFSALDIATSASVSEAFPSAVGEAMACETPCVVTDVGDSAVMVGNTGRIVPAGNPTALALAWNDLLAQDPGIRAQLGAMARKRVQQRFGLEAVAKRYQQMYRQVVCGTASVENATDAVLDMPYGTPVLATVREFPVDSVTPVAPASEPHV